jgi:hypothetical protein
MKKTDLGCFQDLQTMAGWKTKEQWCLGHQVQSDQTNMFWYMTLWKGQICNVWSTLAVPTWLQLRLGNIYTQMTSGVSQRGKYATWLGGQVGDTCVLLCTAVHQSTDHPFPNQEVHLPEHIWSGENKIFKDNCPSQDLLFKPFTGDFDIDINKDSLHDGVVYILAEGLRICSFNRENRLCHAWWPLWGNMDIEGKNT